MITPVGTFQYGRDAMGRLKTITKAKSFRWVMILIKD
jgi:hypothetical protein